MTRARPDQARLDAERAASPRRRRRGGSNASVPAVRAAYTRRVLILPPGHAQDARISRPLSQRERWILRGVLATVAVIAAVVVISVATAGKSSSHGCIYATIPGAVGAEQISQCGATARYTCATVLRPGAYAPASARTIAAECRKAGLPVGG